MPSVEALQQPDHLQQVLLDHEEVAAGARPFAGEQRAGLEEAPQGALVGLEEVVDPHPMDRPLPPRAERAELHHLRARAPLPHERTVRHQLFPSKRRVCR